MALVSNSFKAQKRKAGKEFRDGTLGIALDDIYHDVDAGFVAHEVVTAASTASAAASVAALGKLKSAKITIAGGANSGDSADLGLGTLVGIQAVPPTKFVVGSYIVPPVKNGGSAVTAIKYSGNAGGTVTASCVDSAGTVLANDGAAIIVHVMVDAR